MVQLHDRYFTPFLSTQEIETQIQRLAKQVAENHKGEIPVFIVVLNGAFMFASTFLKHYDGPCEISFVKLASYDGVKSTQNVRELIALEQDVEDRVVIVLEDIVDTGITLEALQATLATKKIKKLEIATLFFKPQAYQKQYVIDYIGIEIPNKFIVGYGLDYKELGRNLPAVYQLKKQSMINLVLFGKPGAGKGTQAEFLKKQYNLEHISTGDVFRFNIKNETELGKLAKSYIDKGELVPDSVTINMLESEVEKNPDANGFIFDGFPRTTAQADALEAFLKTKQMEISATIALEADDAILIERLLERGKVSGRSDDQDEAKIKNRFEEYNQKTAPLITYYTEKNKFHSVNGIGSIAEITERLKSVIDAL